VVLGVGDDLDEQGVVEGGNAGACERVGRIDADAHAFS